MSIIVFDDGAQQIAQNLFHSSTDIVIWLYQNDFVPADTSDYTDFVAATYDGYIAVLVTGAVVSSLGAGFGSLLTWPPVTFTPTDGLVPNDIYGYVVTGTLVAIDATSMWAERAPIAPVPLADISTTLTITLQMTFVSNPSGTIVTPDSGTVALAAYLATVAGAMVLPLSMHLYQNDYTPTTTDTLANYTEATYDGYAAQVMVWASATIPTPGSGALTTWIPLLWTPTGSITPNDIYGYYVTDAAGTLMWAERAPSPPVALNSMLTTLPITPRYGDDSAF